MPNPRINQSLRLTCAVLLLASVSGWVRSCISLDRIARSDHTLEPPRAAASTVADPFANQWSWHARTISLFHFNGSVCLMFSEYVGYRASPAEMADLPTDPRWESMSMPAANLRRREDGDWFFRGITDWRFAGVGLYTASRQGEDSRTIEVPYWLTVLVFSSLGGLLWRRARRDTLRARRGQCVPCGYPLGGAPICPECGARAPANPPPLIASQTPHQTPPRSA